MNPHPTTLDAELLDMLLHELRTIRRPAYQRLWDYYRNEPIESHDEHRAYHLPQEQGLPRRLRRETSPQRERVIENDIGWRIQTLVDFMFGKPPVIRSLAPDPARARLLERILHTALDTAGCGCLFQEMALLGSVYGFVDLVVRYSPGHARGPRPYSPGHARGNPANTSGPRSETDPGHAGNETDPRHAGGYVKTSDGSGTPTAPAPRGAPSNAFDPEAAVHAASQFSIETVEAPRAVGVPEPSDYRKLHAYILHYTRPLLHVESRGFLSRLVDRSGRPASQQATQDVTEIFTADEHRILHDNVLVESSTNSLGLLPVVHIQNLPQPLTYEGLSDVEPLIPLQDELNIRLCDRANRVTMQSFKMYLGKGIENFTERPVGPGQMWMTHNPEATIESFGGDSESPSELAHIEEVRAAMDKTSGVSPLAAGLLTGRIGNLTSENALRITMMGLLTRTQRKRTTYGNGLQQLCHLILHALHVHGVMQTTEAERRIELDWPNPIPD